MGVRYELSRATIETRAARVTPEPISEHAVLVDGRWFPVKQVFEVATGLARSSFTSHEARRHLAALGFDMRGEVARRTPEGGEKSGHSRSTSPGGPAEDDWAREARVQASVVAALRGEGWRIVSTADTATKERGVDVIAEREGGRVGIEVKGYPGRGYADPTRAGETKPTHPSNQAGHWFAQAILAAMKLRSRQPDWRSVIALPRFPRYEHLLVETAGSLAAAGIEVWWVYQDGRVEQA